MLVGEVEPDPPCAGSGQHDRPLAGTAAELEQVLAAHVAQRPDIGLGDLPHPQAILSGLMCPAWRVW